MSGGYVRDADPKDAFVLAPKVREIDCLEIEAVAQTNPYNALVTSFKLPGSQVYSIVRNDGDILGMFGVGDCSILKNYGTPWLIASDDLLPHAKEFLRNCRPWVKKLESNYHCLYNFIHKNNKIAMRWLQWCGFEVQNQKIYSISNEEFYLFVRSISSKNE